MPSARPRRTRRHGSRMGWRHEHARRGPGGGCCQACGARRIARWATQVVTVPHASGAGGAAIGRGRQRQRRRWQPAADLPLQHAPCGAGAGGAARCARAQRGTQRRMLRQPPLHGHAAGSGAGDSGNGSGAAAASPRCRRSAPRRTCPRSPSAAPRTTATRKDKQAVSAGSGVCRSMAVAAHPLTRACEPPWCVYSASMRACAGKRCEA